MRDFNSFKLLLVDVSVTHTSGVSTSNSYLAHLSSHLTSLVSPRKPCPAFPSQTSGMSFMWKLFVLSWTSLYELCPSIPNTLSHVSPLTPTTSTPSSPPIAAAFSPPALSCLVCINNPFLVFSLRDKSYLIVLQKPSIHIRFHYTELSGQFLVLTRV